MDNRTLEEKINDNNAQMARVLRDVIELIESDDFDEDVFLDFVREGHTEDLTSYMKAPRRN